MTADEFAHESVLADEVVELLGPERGGWFLDGTLGGGGHAERILDASPGARVVGLDQDPDALAAARRRLGVRGDRVVFVNGNFRDVARIATDLTEIDDLAGALLDLGVSSFQIDSEARGFSFRRGTPLNMRMGGTTGGGRTAADILNSAIRAAARDAVSGIWRGTSLESCRA